jgi:hypothetical protein
VRHRSCLDGGKADSLKYFTNFLSYLQPATKMINKVIPVARDWIAVLRLKLRNDCHGGDSFRNVKRRFSHSLDED